MTARHVLDDPLPWMKEIVRARKQVQPPVVLSREEVRRILEELDGTPRLAITLLC